MGNDNKQILIRKINKLHNILVECNDFMSGSQPVVQEPHVVKLKVILDTNKSGHNSQKPIKNGVSNFILYPFNYSTIFALTSTSCKTLWNPSDS